MTRRRIRTCAGYGISAAGRERKCRADLAIRPGCRLLAVTIMGEDLADLARLSTARDTTCVVLWADLKLSPIPGAVLGWQVIGLHDGATIARSPIGAIRVP